MNDGNAIAFGCQIITSPAKPSLVTVIIPTCRRPNLLARSISSVIAQDYPTLELLVVDDCVMEATRQVTESFGDLRIRYLPQPSNMGVAAARNRGMREARGDFIAFLDDDDEWLPGKLSLQVSEFDRAGSSTGLVYSGMEVVDSAGNRRIVAARRKGNILKDMLVRNQLHGGGSNVLIRSTVPHTVGYFDESLEAIEDYDYWVRICAAYEVGCVEAPLIRYYDDRTGSAAADARRSTKWLANVRAREDLFRKHHFLMRKYRVAHLYLIDSLRRVAEHPAGTRREAVILGLRIIRERPLGRWTYVALLRQLLRSLHPVRV